ncbi:hypothetical protein BaRGS_00010119, partial [Batillaria attramentaria]
MQWLGHWATMLIVFSSCVPISDGATMSNYESLASALFTNYKKQLRPLLDDQTPTTVYIGMRLASIEVSILAVYLTMLLGQTAMGVVLSVWILNLHFRDDEKPPGKRMRKFAILCQRLMFKRPWST